MTASPAAHLHGQELSDAVLDALRDAHADHGANAWLVPAVALAGLKLGSIRMWDALNDLKADGLLEIDAASHIRLRASTPAPGQTSLQWEG